MGFKRWLGLDLIDLLIHLGTTSIVAGFLVSLLPSPESEAAVFFAFAASFVLLGWRRSRALRHRVEDPEAARVDEVERRLVEVEQLAGRVDELEERLDFAERVLARRRDAERLPGG
jgi:FAD/FMN-containing dehydrogenase